MLMNTRIVQKHLVAVILNLQSILVFLTLTKAWKKTETLSKELENKEYTIVIPEDIKTCEDKMKYFKSIAKELGQ